MRFDSYSNEFGSLFIRSEDAALLKVKRSAKRPLEAPTAPPAGTDGEAGAEPANQVSSIGLELIRNHLILIKE